MPLRRGQALCSKAKAALLMVASIIFFYDMGMLGISIIIFLITASGASLVVWHNRRSAIRSLRWPSGHPLQFIKLCRRHLERQDWAVEQKQGSLFDLLVYRNGLRAQISCRPDGFVVDRGYLQNLYSWRVRYGLPVAVAITYEPVTSQLCLEGAQLGVLLMHYKELNSLPAKFELFREEAQARRRGVLCPPSSTVSASAGS